MFESDLIEELQFIRSEIFRLNEFLSNDFIKALTELTDAVRERNTGTEDFYFINPHTDRMKELLDEIDREQDFEFDEE